MREIDVSVIEQAVRDLCITANKILPSDLEERICRCTECECEELPHSIMQTLQDNIGAAKELDIPFEGVTKFGGSSVINVEKTKGGR